MRPYLLSLFLFLVVGLAKGETANAFNPDISLDDCYALLGNDDDSGLLEKGYVKEVDENSGYDRLYRYVSKNGIVIDRGVNHVPEVGVEEELYIYFPTLGDTSAFIDQLWNLDEVDADDSGIYFGVPYGPPYYSIKVTTFGRVVKFEVNHPN